MNTYVIPIVDDYDDPVPYVKTIMAQSLQACEDKVIKYICDEYSIDNLDEDDYHIFVKELSDEYSIYLGEIIEIDL